MNSLMDEGIKLHREGKLKEAAVYYQRILADAKDHSDAWHLLGLVLHECNEFSRALEHIDRAISLNPVAPAYHNNHGLVLRSLHRFRDALKSFNKAISLKSDYTEAHNNRGLVLRELEEHVEALKSFERALLIQPDRIFSLLNLGQVLWEMGDIEGAKNAFSKAVNLNPNFAAGWNHLSCVLRDQGDYQAAREAAHKALTLAPTVELWHNLGHILADLGDEQGSLNCFFQPVEQAQGGKKISTALVVNPIMNSEADVRRERNAVLQNLIQLKKLDTFILEDPLREVGTTSFYLAYHKQNDLEIQRTLAGTLERACPSLLSEAAHVRNIPEGSSKKVLRIGMVSAFFKHHTMGEVTFGIVKMLNRESFRVVLFTYSDCKDDLAVEFRKSADEVVELSNDLATARKQIGDSEIDVLFYPDIGMDPRTYFLAFARLAPIQMVSWGHPMTTGISNMDFYLSTREYEPSDANRHYSEKLLLLDSLPTFYYRPPRDKKLKTPADFGLAPKEHMYLCTQAPFKLYPDFDLILERILSHDDEAIVCMVRSYEPAWTLQLKRRLQRSLGPLYQRVRFLPHQSGIEYRQLLGAADVLLDSTHFGGGNTTLKALSVGTPIVTWPGEFSRGRVTYACYRRMGIEDCIAHSSEEYVKIALRLGTDPTYRNEVSQRILDRCQVLYEDIGFIRDMEALMRRLFEEKFQNAFS